MFITGLRFINREGRNILQCCGREILGYDDSEARIGLGQNVDWQDVEFEASPTKEKP